MEFVPNIGDIIVTRNEGGDGRGSPNSTPGYWNHCAIMTSVGVVEAQAHVSEAGDPVDDHKRPGRVILTPWREFIERYPIVAVRRMQLYDSEVPQIDQLARTMIGEPYSKYASLKHNATNTAGGVNCVYLVRKVIHDVCGVDHQWKIPDHVGGDESMPLVWSKGILGDAGGAA